MSSTSITHRPIPVATASVAVAAVLAFAGLAVAQNDDTGTPAPSDTSQSLVHHKWHPTTSGGQTQIGLP